MKRASRQTRKQPYQRIKPHNTVTETQIKVIRFLKRENTPVTEIAKALHLSRVHVHRLIRKYCEGQ
jgi:DNA-binding MarR family transcriptional regulator